MSKEPDDLDDILSDSIDGDVSEISKNDFSEYSTDHLEDDEEDDYDLVDEEEESEDSESESEDNVDEDDDEKPKGSVASKILLSLGVVGLVSVAGFLGYQQFYPTLVGANQQGLESGAIPIMESNGSGALPGFDEPLATNQTSPVNSEQVGNDELGLLLGNNEIAEPVTILPAKLTESEKLVISDEPASQGSGSQDILGELVLKSSPIQLSQGATDTSAIAVKVEEPKLSEPDAISITTIDEIGFNKEEFKQQVIKEALEASANNNYATKSEVLSKDQIISIVNNSMASISIPEPVVKSDFVSASDFSKLKEDLESLKKDSIEKRMSEEELNKALSGRDRVKGFVVINKSVDGTMSIVKTPSGNINVYYKGERFNNFGKWVTVTDIIDNGHVVLVSGDLFIDGTEEKREISKPEVKSITKKKAPVKEQPKAEKPEPKKINYENIPSNQLRATMINGKKVAVGYSKNGEYSKGYIIADPNNEFMSYKKGDTIKGLGIISGLDIDGNLIVGDYVIMKVSD